MLTEIFGFLSMKAWSLARKALRFSGGKMESRIDLPLAAIQLPQPSMLLSRPEVVLLTLSCAPLVTPLTWSTTIFGADLAFVDGGEGSEGRFGDLG